MKAFRIETVPGAEPVAELSLGRGQVRLLKLYSDDLLVAPLVGFRTDERAAALASLASSGRYAFVPLEGNRPFEPRMAATAEELLKALEWQWAGQPERLEPGEVSHQAILDCMFTVSLRSGRLIRATHFACGLAYVGILEGTPDDKLNAERRAGCLERAKYDFGAPLVVVEPEIYPLHSPPRPGRRVERLPRMFCTARLESEPIDPDQTSSSITLCWWEEKLDRPLPEVVRARLEGVDWEKAAVDWDFW